MMIFDILYYGTYIVLKNTIYVFKDRSETFGPKEHAFLLIFFVHSLNLFSFVSFVYFIYFNKYMNWWICLLIIGSVYSLGYLKYLSNGHVNSLITQHKNINKSIALIVSITYIIVTILIVLKVGDLIRAGRFSIV
jgi:hypothetical protein